MVSETSESEDLLISKKEQAKSDEGIAKTSVDSPGRSESRQPSTPSVRGRKRSTARAMTTQQTRTVEHVSLGTLGGTRGIAVSKFSQLADKLELQLLVSDYVIVDDLALVEDPAEFNMIMNRILSA